MPKILFLHKGTHAASTRYRSLQYFDCLRQAGWEPTELKSGHALGSYRAALRQAREADVVVVLKKPFTPLYRRLLRRAARRLVFDFDDAIYVRDSGADHPRRRQKFYAMVELCDGVWPGNRELAQEAESFGVRLHVIPTTLDPDRYRLEKPKPETSIDLVWIGSGASRPWLQSIMPALERATERIPGLRLKIVADFSLRSKQLEVLSVPWTPDSEAEHLASAHIGIAPLPDNAFTRGKCGLKILQYMAAGLPVIASSVGVQAQMIRAGRGGFLADDEAAWLDALQWLGTDADLRARMGQAGRSYCEQHYSVESGCRKMVAELDALMKG